MFFLHTVVQLILILLLHSVIGNLLSLLLGENNPISSFVTSVLTVGFIPLLIMMGYSYLFDTGSRTFLLWTFTVFYVFTGGVKIFTKKDNYEKGMAFGLLTGTALMWINQYFLFN